MGWIYLAGDRGKWQVILSMVIYFWFYKMLTVSWLAADLLGFHKELCPMNAY
jgi:hypothetical protein